MFTDQLKADRGGRCDFIFNYNLESDGPTPETRGDQPPDANRDES